MKSAQEELRFQFEQVCSSINALTDKVVQIDEDTRNCAINKLEANTASDSLEKMKATTLQGIEQTRIATEKLQSEQRSLTRVAEESEKKQKLRIKDYKDISRNHVMLKLQVALKQRQIDKLKSDIETIEGLRHKSEKLFDEKMSEIETLQKEYDIKKEKVAFLEKKLQNVNKLKLEKKRCSEMLLIEEGKKMALYNAYGIKIGLSPYNANGNDNISALQHQYYLTLNQKIVDAINTLKKLKETRDDLQNKLNQMTQKLCKFSMEEVESFIQKYNEDIKEKDKEIQKYQEQLQGNQNKIIMKREKNENARLQISNRKCIAQSLKQSNKELRSQLSDSFITEPPEVLYYESSSQIRHNPRIPELNIQKNKVNQPPPPLINSQRYLSKGSSPRIQIPKGISTPRNYNRYALRR